MNTPLKHRYSATDYSNVAAYAEPAAQAVIQRDMRRKSYFQAHFDESGIARRRYDLNAFPLPQAMYDMLYAKGIGKPGTPLDELHKAVPEAMTALDSSGINEVSRQLYDITPDFAAEYRRFVEGHICRELIGEALVMQQSPTLRCYFPKARGFEWRLNYHTDIMLGHPPQEINIWLPFTRAYGSNAMRIAPLAPSLDILGRYGFDFVRFAEAVQVDDALQEELLAITAPAVMEAGEVLLFDSRCLHVLQNNQTDHTRISMDLRVMRLSEYKALEVPYTGTGRRRMPFTVGEYYSSDIVAA